MSMRNTLKGGDLRHRRPRRKPKVFDWKRREIQVVYGDPLRYKARTAMALGDFAYHKTPKEETWTVTHCPSGLAVERFLEEKNARIFTKRLHCAKVPSWKPDRQSIIDYVQFHEAVAELIGKYGVRSKPRPAYTAIDVAAEDYDDDIPF